MFEAGNTGGRDEARDPPSCTTAFRCTKVESEAGCRVDFLFLGNAGGASADVFAKIKGMISDMAVAACHLHGRHQLVDMHVHIG